MILANKRNNLLHATWFIGYSDSDDPDCHDFFVNKYTVTKEGFMPIDLPNTAAGLKALSEKVRSRA